MKKAVTVLIVVAGLFAVLLTLLLALGNMRHNRIAQEPPLTVPEVERLLHEISPEDVAETAAPAAGESVDEPPLRLERVATEEQRRNIFVKRFSGKEKWLVFFGSGPLGAIADTATVAAGRPEGQSWARATCNLFRGNWNEARLYYAEFLKSSVEDEFKQRVCGYLAWLEDDSEVALRYAEAACSGDDWPGTLLTLELAVATGSTDLAEYAIARGRAVTSHFDDLIYYGATLDATRQWLSERQEKSREPER